MGGQWDIFWTVFNPDKYYIYRSVYTSNTMPSSTDFQPNDSFEYDPGYFNSKFTKTFNAKSNSAEWDGADVTLLL